MRPRDMRRRQETGDAPLLVVRDLDVAYDQTQVLFGVDLEVDEGEIVALLGTNGAGKSTLLKAISGWSRPTAASIIFDGRDISGRRRRARSRTSASPRCPAAAASSRA